jgi:hypothetical protein
MLPLPRRINSLGKPHPLISDRRSTIYLPPLSRRSMGLGTRGRERSMFARNLPPVERGSPDQRGGIQLNRLLVSYRCSVSVGLAAHSWKGQLWTWLLVQAARSRRRKGRRVNVTRAVCSQPRGNHAVPSLQSRQLPDLATYFYMRGANKDSSQGVNRNRPRGHPSSLSSQRRSKILMWLSTVGLVFCQEFAQVTASKVAYLP